MCFAHKVNSQTLLYSRGSVKFPTPKDRLQQKTTTLYLEIVVFIEQVGNLFRLLVRDGLLAKLTKFLQFQTSFDDFLVFLGLVITAFANRTFHVDECVL